MLCLMREYHLYYISISAVFLINYTYYPHTHTHTHTHTHSMDIGHGLITSLHHN